MKKQKAEKKVVVISERTQRNRISFRDYTKNKDNVKLTVDWIFLPIKFKTYGLLLSDGNEEYRISLNVNPERAEKILSVFDFKIGKSKEGKVLLVCKHGREITVEEGEDEVIYEWIPGKGWRLTPAEEDNIPF